MKQLFWLNIIALNLFFIDRLSKYWALYKLPQEGVFLFGKGSGSIGFQLYKNTGIAWSIQVPLALLYVIIFCLLAWLLWSIIHTKANLYLRFAWVIILLGAFSNVIDRFLYNGVIDFIQILIWPVFNISDMMIVIGVFIWLGFEMKKTKKSELPG